MGAFLRAGKITSHSAQAVLFISSALVLSGCSSIGYLLQAGKGQMALFNHARPIPEVLRDERTPPRIQALLGEISRIKAFGEEQGLKPTQNYTEYVKLDRRAVVWVVSACEPLQFKAREWSFPIVGSFPYLGWFDVEDAKKYAADLKKDGLDVDVRGAGAYSTLGWFRDAVLSTMIPEGDEALGALIDVVIHESVHATIYVKGQSYFNESLASFVASKMTPEYLDRTRGQGTKERAAYLAAEERGERIRKKLHEAYLHLSDLYGSTRPEAEKLEEKQKILVKLKADLEFKRDINNATLIQYKTYHSGHEDFEYLFKKKNSAWGPFLGALKGLKPESFHEAQSEDFKSVLESL